MKKKSLLISILLSIALIVLLTAAILLLIDRTSAKNFSDIVPKAELLDSCQVICADGDKVLTNDELDGFLSQLDQLQYYKRGSYGNVMEGNVYHAFFASQQTGAVEIHISDAGKIYTNSTCYEFAPEADPQIISSYLEALLHAE